MCPGIRSAADHAAGGCWEQQRGGGPGHRVGLRSARLQDQGLSHGPQVSGRGFTIIDAGDSER